jgi:2-polyprenyl-3-methyl-5-hydroxy-6-metoxy-1,4-benzoquinol methylase
MNAPLVGVKCPICAGVGVRPRFTLTRSDLSEKPSYKIQCCGACGHQWAEGPASKEMFSEIYSKYFYGTGQQSVPHRKDGSLTEDAEQFPALFNARRRAAALHDLGMKGRLLDVGCGVGYFVIAAMRDFDAQGIEIEEAAVQKAIAIGAKVALGDVMAVGDGYSPRFEVVTLWDVFSGFDDPKRLSSLLLDRVVPSGFLVLTVPDAGSRIARLLGKRWPLMIPPGNMHFFSEQSVRCLFAGSDVASITILRETKRVSVDFLAHKLLRALDLHHVAKWWRPIPKKWTLPINLGDIMTVIVKKSPLGQ